MKTSIFPLFLCGKILGGFFMLLKNFLLSRAKIELSPQLNHLSKTPGSINRAIKKVIADIDNIVLDHEGVSTKEHLKTKRRYEALETVLSFLVREGFSQVRQEYISKKSGISKPLINDILAWLEDLGVCQQIKTRRHGKKSPSIYILTLHNNYLKIIEYFKTKWSLLIEVTSTFTKILTNKINQKKQSKTPNKDIPKIVSKGINHFDLEEDSTQENNRPKKYRDRTKDLEDYLTEDQQKAYFYIIGQHMTNLSEKDAYVIANRLPGEIDDVRRRLFEDCVLKYKFIKCEQSNVAHFMETFENEIKLYIQRKQNKAREEKMSKNSFNNPMFNWLEADEDELQKPINKNNKSKIPLYNFWDE